MRLAVTGAFGLIGGNVLRAGLARGHDVVAIARDGSACGEAETLGVKVARADMLGGQQALVAAFAGSDAVIHTAAVFSYQLGADALHRAAVEGTRAVLQAAATAGVGRVVVTSSSVVFGHSPAPATLAESDGLADPATEPAYVAAKIAQHRAALELGERFGIEIVLACPTISVGPTASTLGPSNGLILLYLGDRTKATYPGGCNIVSAEDVGAGHVLLAEAGAAGQAYLLGSENLRWSEIHREIGRLTGLGGPLLEISRSLAQVAAGAEELAARIARRAPLSTRAEAGMLGRYYWYDDAKARALGYAPQPAAEALLAAISWLVASSHVPRELRAQIHLADDVHRWRYGKAA